MALDSDFVRAQFPAFQEASLEGQAFFENAGGSYMCRQVIDRLTRFYRERKVQPYYAFDASRLERGFRSWGHDVGPVDEPFGAGLGFAVSRTKEPDFVGRGALEALRDAGRDRRLVSVHAPDAVLWHGESIVRGDERLGHVTSAGVAPTLGGSAGLAWIHGDPGLEGWAVEIRGEAAPVTLQVDPFYDPRGERLRS